jgi:hypothetical protein
MKIKSKRKKVIRKFIKNVERKKHPQIHKQKRKKKMGTLARLTSSTANDHITLLYAIM